MTTMDDVLDRLDRDRDRHMLSPAVAAQDFALLERELGRALPVPLRRLLERLGGGILYERHELFGPRRLMIHDIELVPDVMSIRQRLRARPEGLPANLLPLHRCEGEMHFVDLAQPETAPVVSEDGRTRWPALADFLEAAICPPGDPAPSS